MQGSIAAAIFLWKCRGRGRWTQQGQGKGEKASLSLQDGDPEEEGNEDPAESTEEEEWADCLKKGRRARDLLVNVCSALEEEMRQRQGTIRDMQMLSWERPRTWNRRCLKIVGQQARLPIFRQVWDDGNGRYVWSQEQQVPARRGGQGTSTFGRDEDGNYPDNPGFRTRWQLGAMDGSARDRGVLQASVARIFDSEAASRQMSESASWQVLQNPSYSSEAKELMLLYARCKERPPPFEEAGGGSPELQHRGSVASNFLRDELDQWQSLTMMHAVQ